MQAISYARHHFPPEIIRHAVWLYLRFTLSYRDVEELLAERGIQVTYETVRRWVCTFGPLIARRLRAQRPARFERWHLDEMFVQIGGKQMYLWRAVDGEGEVLEVLVQAKRDRRAACKLMRKLLKKQGIAPSEWVTDKCPAYGAALRDLGLDSARHLRGKRMNNRAESAHGPVRRRERKQQGFKAPGSAQRFVSIYSAVYNVFNVCRHLTSARTHRLLRAEACGRRRAWPHEAGQRGPERSPSITRQGRLHDRITELEQS